ncbi:MAG: S-(hydroxymethyl)mycothiol dehydrogenase [Actinomycetota bacterium]|nr:S-(hydroxymethyl)mycothiol dehydrogenase [Actinomycetota bacterium]
MLIRVVASGVCHTDAHVWRRDGWGYEFPILLGHEGAGVVEQVGDGVTNVQPGDRVVITWSAPCGACGPCGRGDRGHCAAPVSAGQRLRLAGTDRVVAPVLRTGTFTTYTVVDARQAIRVPDALALDQACLLACGVVTGMGAALRTSPVWPGATVAVFGCGGVGLSVMQGARIAGAARIIAIDTVPAKLETARRFGATDVVDAADHTVVSRVRALGSDEDGVDFAFDAVGAASSVQHVVDVLGDGGTATLIGIPDAGARIGLDANEAFGNAITVRVCHGGNCEPAEFLPYLAGLYLDGRLDLDSMVSRTITLDDVPEAFAAMDRGEVIRSVITFTDP